jgi:hypothetical protein
MLYLLPTQRKANTKMKLSIFSFEQIVKLELEPLELSSVIASLGKSRHYFECVRKDQDTADSLQQIRLKLIRQGEKEVVKGWVVDYENLGS